MKAIRRTSKKILSVARHIGRAGRNMAASRLRMLLGTGIIAILCPLLSAAAEPAATSTDNGVVPPATAMPAMPEGFSGIGPVVSGSASFDDLPSKARKFLAKHCDGHAVVKLDKEYASGSYDLRLADGIEMEFDSKGNMTDIEAPEGYSIAPVLLKAVVPGKLYHLLVHNGFSESVAAVHHDRAGYRLEISDPVFDSLCYDPSGVLTMIVDK